MPRIAVAVGTFVLAAFSIGFNTVRYPLVWDMVGSPPRTPQPNEPLQPVTLPQPSAISPSETFTRSTTPGATTLDTATPDTATPDTPTRDTATRHTAAAADPSPGARDAGQSDPEDPPAASPQGFAAARPGRHNPWAGFGAQADTADEPSSDELSVCVTPIEIPRDPPAAVDIPAQLRRLPPIDRVAPPAADRRDARLPDALLPVYPQTGA